jgi:surfactin synthase thioesterase subunit
VKKVREAIHTQPREEFFASLKELGGCPEALLQDEALKDCFEPIIRADFQALADYQYEPAEAFNIPITVMTGVEEDISREEALAWQQETTGLVAVKAFAGDHFFIYGHERAIVNIMTGVMLQQQQKALRRPAAETLLAEPENERLW